MEYHKSRLRFFSTSKILASSVLLLLLFISISGDGSKTAKAGTDAWSIETSPNPGTFNNYLNAVSLADASNVWAVGSYDVSGTLRTLALKWNGTSWSQQTTSSPFVGNNELYAVDARTTSDVWAVGNSEFNNSTYHFASG